MYGQQNIKRSLTRFQCALWHHLVETTHWHSLFFYSIPTEYYPFKRCQVPVGHSVLYRYMLLPLVCHYMLFPTGVNGARLDGPKAPWQNKSASPRFSFECCPLICAILRAQCISVCPHGTTRLPLDGFSWNLTFELISKIYGENLTASVV